MRRILWIAANTFTEALRQRFFAFLLLLGVALAASGSLLRVFDFGNSELKFSADFGFGGMFLFGSILSVVMTAQLFFSELDNRTALPLLARPVRRWEFFLGKFFGIWALLGVFVVALGAVLGGMLLMRYWDLAATAEAIRTANPKAPSPPPTPWFSVSGFALAGLLQWVRLGVVASVTLLVCSFARTFLYAVIVATMSVLVCQMQGIGRVAFTKADNAGWVRTLADVLGRVIPDLQLFDLGVPLALQPEGVPLGTLFSALGYGALYVPVLLLVAVWLFNDREI
ncbi:MAG: ABC transporter permease subunit [Puniceicoccales bacterium]|jgi:ABC-type transport system involved in multi-copper enzyme maturation permease subunit|nr:ABC transporter permease subunit [Puniceicoccales bacterium]